MVSAFSQLFSERIVVIVVLLIITNCQDDTVGSGEDEGDADEFCSDRFLQRQDWPWIGNCAVFYTRHSFSRVELSVLYRFELNQSS